MALIDDQELTTVLLTADTSDLAILSDFITDKGEGRISLSAEICRNLTWASKSGQFSNETRLLMAEEIQRFGGNSLVNLLRRGSGISYREIACDVAEHVKAPHNPKSDCLQIEKEIILKVMEQVVGNMDDEQKRQLFNEFGVNYLGAGPASLAALISAINISGFAAFKMTTVIANSVAGALIGRGLALGANAALMRGIGVFAGPIGWGITAIWTAFDLASPAYRVTVPCVIQIAYMRQKALIKECPKCHLPIPVHAKFCAECGHRVTSEATLA